MLKFLQNLVAFLLGRGWFIRVFFFGWKQSLPVGAYKEMMAAQAEPYSECATQSNELKEG